MEERILYCPACTSRLHLLAREDIQLGKQSFWHDWNHLLHGSLDVEIYICPRCGRLEFYAPLETVMAREEENKHTQPGEIVAYKCADCGKILTTDMRCCPNCGETDRVMVPQIRCPHCGAIHDFDDPKCPVCGQS